MYYYIDYIDFDYIDYVIYFEEIKKIYFKLIIKMKKSAISVSRLPKYYVVGLQHKHYARIQC